MAETLERRLEKAGIVEPANEVFHKMVSKGALVELDRRESGHWKNECPGKNKKFWKKTSFGKGKKTGGSGGGGRADGVEELQVMELWL